MHYHANGLGLDSVDHLNQPFPELIDVVFRPLLQPFVFEALFTIPVFKKPQLLDIEVELVAVGFYLRLDFGDIADLQLFVSVDALPNLSLD